MKRAFHLLPLRVASGRVFAPEINTFLTHFTVKDIVSSFIRNEARKTARSLSRRSHERHIGDLRKDDRRSGGEGDGGWA